MSVEKLDGILSELVELAEEKDRLGKDVNRYAIEASADGILTRLINELAKHRTKEQKEVIANIIEQFEEIKGY